MGLSIRQAIKVASYVAYHKLKGTKRFPLVLMLEPLFRCNLECAGCGKIQYPEETLKKRLTPDQCFHAIEECGAPVVSIAGGEPLIHPEMPEIVRGMIDRGKFIYFCTNAILLERDLDKYQPSPYLNLSIHLDGLEARHDHSVCRDGVFKKAVEAIKVAKERGFRVTTNTTVFEWDDPQEMRDFFDYVQGLGVDGMMISPGYAYEKAPDQAHFLAREKTKELFREALRDRHKYNFNHSPFFLDFLEGGREYACTPWGNPTRNIFGWQKPCYLMAEGYTETYRELIEETEWDNYGTGNHPKCAQCMVHSGYEASAVLEAFGSMGGLVDMAASVFNPKRRPRRAGRGFKDGLDVPEQVIEAARRGEIVRETPVPTDAASASCSIPTDEVPETAKITRRTPSGKLDQTTTINV